MHIFLLVILFQVKQTQNTSVDITSPQVHSVRALPQKSAPNLSKPEANSTPTLTPETALHLEMEREIGGQEEAVGNLNARVGALEEKRDNHDRPDIDTLKTSRLHVLWTLTMLGTVIATIVGAILKFKEIIWSDIIRPRLKREIIGTQEN
jgi:hypothetical protein